MKSPVEFTELQQKLIKEGVEAAVSDGRHIAQLTSAVFTSAFEPVKKQIEAVQRHTPSESKIRRLGAISPCARQSRRGAG